MADDDERPIPIPRRVPFPTASGRRGNTGVAALLVAMTLCVAACTSTSVQSNSQRTGTWQPAVNERGMTVEQAMAACRKAAYELGYDSVLVLQTMAGVCMRDQGFEVR